MSRTMQCMFVALLAVPHAVAVHDAPTTVWDADAALNAALHSSAMESSIPSQPAAAIQPKEAVADDQAKPFSKLSLSKVFHSVQKTHDTAGHSAEAELGMEIAKAPKQLAGYLGLKKKVPTVPTASFSTQWGNALSQAAPAPKDTRSEYMRVLQDGFSAAPKKALVTKAAKVSHASPRFFDVPDINWNLKATHKDKPALATQSTEIHKSNKYLASVGWTPSADPHIEDRENPYLQTLHDSNGEQKKFLAATEKAATVTGKNTYAEDILPGPLQTGSLA